MSIIKLVFCYVYVGIIKLVFCYAYLGIIKMVFCYVYMGIIKVRRYEIHEEGTFSSKSDRLPVPVCVEL